jgi:tetratricopeptide (TPR) repeat protein
VVVDIRRKRTEKLTTEGFECLKRADYREALKIAAQLEELRFSASFEIAAQAHAGLGDIEKAVFVLEQSVRLAPDVWLNWQLLGNYLSDLERFEKAESAYQNALKCTNAWVGSIRLNQAILANRQSKFGEALLILDKIDDKELLLQKSEASIYSLQGLKRIDDAMSLAKQILNEISDDEKDIELFGRVAATLGRLRLMNGKPKAEVRKWAVDALEIYAYSTMLLALIRDIDAKYSEKANYYRLLIHGIIPINSPRYSEAKGFYTTYDVVADNSDEALNFVREFEEEDVKGNLFIEEESLLEQRPHDPKGVYWHSEYFFYTKENEDKR